MRHGNNLYVMPEVKEQREVPKPVLEPGVLKAFVAGLVIGNLNKQLMLGFVVGGLLGVYLQQNQYDVPNVKDTWKDFIRKWDSSSKK